jgi:hypothetical protein
MTTPWQDDRTVGTINIGHVNVSDLLSKLVEFSLRYGADLDLYIDGNNLVIFAPRGAATQPLPLEERREVGMHWLADILGRITR